MTVPVIPLDLNPVITKTTDNLLILFNAFLASGGAFMTAPGHSRPGMSPSLWLIERLLCRLEAADSMVGD